jgi:hypothetical protein
MLRNLLLDRALRASVARQYPSLPPDRFVRLAGPRVGKMIARMFCILSVLFPYALPLPTQCLKAP